MVTPTNHVIDAEPTRGGAGGDNNPGVHGSYGARWL